MNESDVKRKIVTGFKEAGHYARRIEDSFSVGFPDLVIAHRDLPVFFTEVKIVSGNVFGPTPRQYVELQRLAISRYTLPTILGYKDGSHYLAQYCASIHIAGCVAQRPSETIVQLYERFYYERKSDFPRLDQRAGPNA